MKLSRFISKLQDLQEELPLFITHFDGTQYPLHSVFAPCDEYIEIYSDEWDEERSAITVKECLRQIEEYNQDETTDKSIKVNIIVGNEDDTSDTIDDYLKNIVVTDKVLLS